MSYFAETSSAGEDAIHIGQFHWYYDVIAFSWLISMIILAVLVTSFGVPFAEQFLPKSLKPNLFLGILALVIVLNGFLRFLVMMMRKKSTEIVITNRRLIFKRGVVARRIDEVQADRIEGCIVYQGFMGRLLGFGTVVVRGTGVGEIFLPPLRDPLAFRRAIEMAVNQEKPA